MIVIPDVDMLRLNYQELDINENATTVGWMTDEGEGICNTFILQGFTLPTIQSGDLTEQEFSITVFNSYTATIPSVDYVNSAGDVIVYRVVAVENGTICYNRMIQETPRFYRFDGKLCESLIMLGIVTPRMHGTACTAGAK